MRNWCLFIIQSIEMVSPEEIRIIPTVSSVEVTFFEVIFIKYRFFNVLHPLEER